MRTNIPTAADRDLQFGNIDNAGTWASFMTVAENGCVGIGTTSPLTNLHLQRAGSVGTNLSFLTLTNNVPGTAGNAASIDFNPTSDVGSVYSRLGAIMETSNRAAFYVSTYNPSNGFGERFRIDGFGNVGIGTCSPDAKLAVNGTIHTKEVKVDLEDWPDYVFKPAYKLPSLLDIKAFIDKNQHLPEMPSEQEVAKNGINLGEMNKLLAKKIEELTLYAIEQKEQLIKQQKKGEQQETRIAALENALLNLTSK